MIGAIGEQIGKDPVALGRLRSSLNPFSRFNFGLLAGLRYAAKWQAQERHCDTTGGGAFSPAGIAIRDYREGLLRYGSPANHCGHCRGYAEPLNF